MTHAIEALADQAPDPWGVRIEAMLRELGGIIWIQIASAIVLLRLTIWLPFHLWRVSRERERGSSTLRNPCAIALMQYSTRIRFHRAVHFARPHVHNRHYANHAIFVDQATHAEPNTTL